MIRSIELAKILNTNHRDLLIKIRKIEKEVENFQKGIQETTYAGINGRAYRCMLLTEKAAIYLASKHRNKNRETLKKIKEGGK